MEKDSSFDGKNLEETSCPLPEKTLRKKLPGKKTANPAYMSDWKSHLYQDLLYLVGDNIARVWSMSAIFSHKIQRIWYKWLFQSRRWFNFNTSSIVEVLNPSKQNKKLKKLSKTIKVLHSGPGIQAVHVTYVTWLSFQGFDTFSGV